ncbi:MAG: hypothetical protein H6955_14370 [Chromatiaceae bacterium]|nr:hypothetical protein [Gammaproteobacteria bacterium]MCP5314740.1 hypothetical protein [Chromatiaceae bacterium]
MQLPERDQQIVQAHAGFICEAVRLLQQTDGGPRLDALLRGAAEQGWHALVAAIRRMADGQRDLRGLDALDDEDRVIATAILSGLQDPRSLPDPTRSADPTLAAPGLAHMIHAAARGDVQALTLISQMAEQMSRAGGDLSRLAAVIRPMINGERDADRLAERLDTRGRQLLLQILEELGRLELH